MPAPTFDAHLNLAVSSIAVAPSPPTSGTSITVGSGEGARFPAVPFNATIGQPAALLTPLNAEIVRVTAKSGDVFTITRAQEGTAARSIAVGDLIGATITAKTITDVEGAFTGVARTDLANVFTVDQKIQASGPSRFAWNDTSQAADQRLWKNLVAATNFSVNAVNDAETVALAALTLNRSGDATIYRDLYEKGRTTPLGHWIAVPFNSANFTATGGTSPTWTVNAAAVVQNSYCLIGKTMWWAFYISWFSGTSTVNGSPTTLNMALPAPQAGIQTANQLAYCTVNGVIVQAYMNNAGGILRTDGGTFAGTVGFLGQIMIPIS